MKKLSKAEKSERLVELTDSGISRRRFDSSIPAEHRDLRRTLEEDSRKLQIELRAKHYSEEQLDALLGFYESEIGTTILHANKRIREEFSDGYRGLGQNLAAKFDGGIRLEEMDVKKDGNMDRDDDTQQ